MNKAAKKTARKTKKVADMPDLSSVYRRPKMEAVSDLIARRKAAKKAERNRENAAIGFMAIAAILGIAVVIHWYFIY